MKYLIAVALEFNDLDALLTIIPLVSGPIVNIEVGVEVVTVFNQSTSALGVVSVDMITDENEPVLVEDTDLLSDIADLLAVANDHGVAYHIPDRGQFTIPIDTKTTDKPTMQDKACWVYAEADDRLDIDIEVSPVSETTFSSISAGIISVDVILTQVVCS